MTFNPEQLQVIEFGTGPCVVAAPAGSGKTRCFVHRIARLIEKGTLSSQILGVTFTKAAAESIKERLSFLVTPEAQLDLNISTIHSLCWSIVRDTDKGLAKAMSAQQFLLPSYVFRGFLEKFTIEFGDLYDFTDVKFSMIKSAIGLAKNYLIAPESSEEFFRSLGHVLHAAMLQDAYRYCERERLNYSASGFTGRYDQDDVMVKAAELLSDAVVQRRWASKFNFILVDEAQDTTPIQFHIIELLGKRHNNIMLVGDVRQSIYGFRGGSPSHIWSFTNRLQAAQINLLTNYRSHHDIVGVANAIADNMTDIPAQFKVPMVPSSTSGTSNRVSVLSPEGGFIGEAEMVTSDIKEYLNLGNSPSDIAILYRTNAQSAIIERELINHQLPYSVRSGGSFFCRKEIYQVIFFLAVAYCNNIDALVGYSRKGQTGALQGIGNIPTPSFGKPTRYLGKEILGMVRTLFKSAQATEVDPDLLDSIREAWDAIQDRRFKPGLQDLIEMIESLRTYGGETPQEVISWVFENVYEEHIRLDIDDNEDAYYDKVANIAALQEIAGGHTAIVSFVDYCLERLFTTPDFISKNGVSLMTIHASKGLEFKRVYVLGLNEGYLPHSRGDQHEERRLFYVATTRAEQELLLSSPIGPDQLNRSSAALEPSKFLSYL